MYGVSKRRQIKLLLRGGQSQRKTSERTGVSLSTVKRIAKEPDPVGSDDRAERKRRQIGRPSVVQDQRELVDKLLRANPKVKSAEILKQVDLNGYLGKKSALYALVASTRSRISGKETSAIVERSGSQFSEDTISEKTAFPHEHPVREFQIGLTLHSRNRHPE